MGGMGERWVTQQAVMKWMAMSAKLAVRFGGKEGGVDLEVLLHGEELDPKHLLLRVQLQGQWGVAEHVAGTQRDVVPADSQQKNVVNCWQGRFLWAEEGDPDGEGVRYQRVGELELKHAALERALGQADNALLNPGVGAPGPHARLAGLLHIRRSCSIKKKRLLFCNVCLVRGRAKSLTSTIKHYRTLSRGERPKHCDKDNFLTNPVGGTLLKIILKTQLISFNDTTIDEFTHASI